MCKKVIAWGGDFGMDQYVSWNLPKEDLYLDSIWDRFEEFCKLQSNEVRVHFDLLTRFCQGNTGVDECYNAVQPQVNLAKYSLRLLRSCIVMSSGSWRMKILYPEQLMRAALILTISLQAKCASLQRKWRAQRPLQGTSGRLQVTHKLPRSILCTTSTHNFNQAKIRRENKETSKGNLTTRIQSIQHHASLRGTLIPMLHTNTKIDAPSLVTLLIWGDFNVQPRNSNANLATSLAILQIFVIRRINRNKLLTSLGSQRPIN